MRITAYTKYGRTAASTRQRLLQYIPYLAKQGIAVDYQPLLGDDYVRALGTGGRFSRGAVLRGYANRMKRLIRGDSADLLWVYAELFPQLPGAFERLAFRSGKPVVYDFDDAFFHPYDDSPSRLKRTLLGGKLEPLLSGAALCLCGNRYLEDYAARFCKRTMILPTVVDTDDYTPIARDTDRPPTIGWIGSSGTWVYLEPLMPLLERLAKRHGARIRIVGAPARAARYRFAGLELADWSEESEVEEVQNMDIGIMPMIIEDWARGKSGFKLIQYMACGLPVVATPVGVNEEIVADGTSGYLARTEDQWEQALTALIADPARREKMGRIGRERAVADYSLATHAPRFAQAVKGVAGAPA